MVQRTWARGMACLCGLIFCAALVAAQEKKPAQEPKAPEAKKTDEGKKPEPQKVGKPEAGKGDAPGGEMGGMDPEMMKKWMEYATPGEAHKRLEMVVGKWDYELKWWMDPAGEPQSSKGTSEMKSLFDGRYFQQEVTGPAEGPDGKPFKGLGLCGYDNLKKKYISIWLDNMGTGMMVTEGACDAAGKIITMTGEMADPMSGKTNEKVRTVTKLDGNDKFSFEMYVPGPDGKEFKNMEITYTRAK